MAEFQILAINGKIGQVIKPNDATHGKNIPCDTPEEDHEWEPESISAMTERLFCYDYRWNGRNKPTPHSESTPRETLLAEWLAERSRTVEKPQKPNLAPLIRHRQIWDYVALLTIVFATLSFFAGANWAICLGIILVTLVAIFLYEDIATKRIQKIRATYQQAYDRYQTWHDIKTGKKALCISEQDFEILRLHDKPLNIEEFYDLFDYELNRYSTMEQLNAPGVAESIYDDIMEDHYWGPHSLLDFASLNVITFDPEICDILRAKLLGLIDPWLECLKALIDLKLAEKKLTLCRAECDTLGWSKDPNQIKQRPGEPDEDYARRLKKLRHWNELMDLAREECTNTKFVYERLAMHYDDLHHEIEQYAAIIASAKRKEKMSEALDRVSQTYIPKAKAEHALDLQESYVELAKDLIKKQALHQQDLEESRRELSGNDPL